MQVRKKNITRFTQPCRQSKSLKYNKIKKIKYTIILFLAFLTIAFYISGCKDPDPVYNQVRQELKDWGAFKEGTWWVYEEENLKIRDSVYIYLQETEEFRLDPRNQPNHYDYKIISHFASSTNIDLGLYDVSSIGSGPLMRREMNDGGEHSLQCYLVVLPPVQGDFIRTGGPRQHTIFDTIYPKLQIGDNEFTNVVRANNNMNLFYNGTPTLLYSAKHIGIVRKEFPEYNQVWNLVKYNIVH